MKINWKIIFGSTLFFLSLLLYLSSIIFFHDEKTTVFYFLQDLSFLPLQIVVVTLLLDQFISSKEKKTLIKKLNMVIGVFFSEHGTKLIKLFTQIHTDLDNLKEVIDIKQDSTMRKKNSVKLDSAHLEITLKIDDQKLASIKHFLLEKRNFLLSLLENPNLLEHESFTDLLWAIFHLTEELEYRQNLDFLTKNDRDHVKGDILRVYRLIISEWILYMYHLKTDYPYLYSLALRLNPFLPEQRVEFK